MKMRRNILRVVKTGLGLLIGTTTILCPLASDVSVKAQGSSVTYVELLAIGKGTPQAVAWNPKDHRLVVAGSSGVWLYDDKLELQSQLRFGGAAASDSFQIESVSWKPDGTRIAATMVGASSTIQIWDAKTAQPTLTITSPLLDPFIGVWSPDGKQIAATGDIFVDLWDTTSGKQIAKLKGHKSVVDAIAWSPDGKQLASLSITEQIGHIWDVQSGQSIATLQLGKSGSIAWSPDGKQLAINDGNDVQIWDATTFQLTNTLHGHTDLITALDWSKTGLASGSYDATIRIWDVSHAQTLQVLTGHAVSVSSVRWNGDGQKLISIGDDSTVRIWSAATGQMDAILPDYTSSVEAVAWRPDNSQIVSGSHSAVQIWNPFNAQLDSVAQVTDNATRDLTWNPDGSQFVSASSDGNLYVWKGGANKPQLTISAHEGGANSVSWSPDGSKLASGGEDKQVKVWNATTGQIIATFQGHTASVRSVRWSPDGSRLASGSRDGTVRVWDISTSQLTASLKTGLIVGSIAWSPDGTHLATGGQGVSKIWDVSIGKPDMTLVGDQVNYINSVAWRPDGLKLAGGGADGTLYIWDVKSGHVDTSAKAHTQGIASVSWSSQGNKLLTGSHDGIIKIFWMPPTVNDLQKQISTCVSDRGIVTSLTAKISQQQWAAFIDEVKAQSDKNINALCASEMVETAIWFSTHT